MTEIAVIAEFVMKPNKRDEAVAILKSIIEPTRAEPGCISYELCADQKDENKFAMIERWQDRESLNSHSQQVFIHDAIEAIKDKLTAEIKLRLFSPVS